MDIKKTQGRKINDNYFFIGQFFDGFQTLIDQKEYKIIIMDELETGMKG